MFQPSASLFDRAAGALLGSAVGDALGAGYEFYEPDDIDDVEMRPGILTGRPAGSWTDDTDMAWCVATAAAEGCDLTTSEGLERVAELFLQWYESDPRDVGVQTQMVLSRTVRPSEMAAAARAFQESRPDAAGNGSLMRTAPVALAHLGDDDAIIAAARAVSSLTHPHEDAQWACALWSLAIDRAVRGTDDTREAMESALEALPSRPADRWRSLLHEAEQREPNSFSKNGWVVEALQGAWRSVDELSIGPWTQFPDRVNSAVMGGYDTDTVAAIAGGFAGAIEGSSVIPWEWRKDLRGWPEGVTDGDLVRLAVQAVRKGGSDAAGWPSVDDMTSYYEEEWSPRGLCVEVPQHPGVWIGDIGALNTQPAHSVLSLCRIGRNQRRENHFEAWLVDGTDNNSTWAAVATAADGLERLYRDHGSVFLHCVQAEQRTPAVLCHWLAFHQGYEFDAAQSLVDTLLPNTRWDSPFMDGALDPLWWGR